MIIKRIELVNYCQHEHRVIDISGNLIAVVGHNGCLAEGTLVRLADGSVKPVEAVKAGDRLLAFDDEGARLTASTVYDMIRTEPNQKKKPILEVTINGETTRTTYDHPFFAGDGFYPLYQLVWGALEAGQRTRLKLLCEQYGAPFDDATVWQQNSGRDEARPRPAWVLQDHARWAYREGAQSCGGELAGEPKWVYSSEPYRLRPYKQQGGEPGVVHDEVQCVVWGNPWQHCEPETGDLERGGASGGDAGVGGEAEKLPEARSRGFGEADPRGGGSDSRSGGAEDDSEEHSTASLRVSVLEAAPYYTIRMREAPYTYCVGRRNCYLTHNCGKSNLLGALQFALTGEQPGKTKADLLRWGAKEGYVVLDFEQDGKPGRIERYVSSNKVTLEYDGVTTSGITNVAKEMETRLRMDRDLVKQSVFVRQKEVDTIISAKTDKRDREVAFQKLLGLDAAKIHKNMTDWLYSAAKPMNYDIQLTDATRKLGELEARKTALDADVKAAETALAEFGEVDESQGANLARAMAAVSHVLRLQAEVGSCGQAVVKAAENEARAKQAALAAGANPGYDLAELTGQEAALKDEIRKARALELGQARLQDAQAQAARVAPPAATPEDIAKLAGERDAVAAELATVRSEMAMRAKSVKALNGDESVCPVCGKVLDVGMVERLRGELKTLERREVDLAGKTSALDRQLVTKRMDLDRWTRESAQYNARVEAERAALASLETPKVARATAESVLEQVTAQLAAQRAYDTAAADHAKAVSDAEIKSDVAEKALSTARSQLAAAEAEALRLCGDGASADWSQAQAAMDAAVKKTDWRRARHTELRMAVTRSTAMRDEVVNTIANMTQTVASLKEAQAAQDRLARRLKVIEEVRDWFHYANGPRVLVTQALDALTGTVNQLLGNFTAPFIAIPDQEQVGFRVEFTDGRARRAEPPGTDALSGGECVQLAVAFRLAIYRMFAGKLGLLSLDEPTAYLDDANVDRFGVLLTKVRELARDMHTQVLMATHERAIMPHMDSVIDLN